MLIQGSLILIFVVILSLMTFLYFSISKAPASVDITFNPPGVTNIFSADGVQLARLCVENRKVVPIEQIPKTLQNATIAFEDKRFYQHQGVDWIGISRALGKNLKSGDLKGQGGSTITQQLARNMGVEGLTREKSIQRKFHEWVVANQIEKSYTKQQILEMYLNQVSYGQGAYGVQAAAQTYFGKDVQNLDLAQCALLAGLPNRPAVFNPYKDKKAAEAQRNIVLDNMREQHYITPEQCAKAQAEYIHLASAKPPSQGNHIYHANYFVDYVIDQLKHKYGEDTIQRGNLNVYTTLNWKMQQMAEQDVKAGIAEAADRGATQGSLVALDPKTGEIRAMVGGVDYKTNQVNYVWQAQRQPGSSFKAVVYAAAIDSDAVTEQTRVYDGPEGLSFRQASGKTWTPHDDNGYSYSHVDLRQAMARSINVPAVRVLKEIGPQAAIRYARMMGVESPLDPVLSLALGSSPVTPLEMATVYATIAAGGNHPVPTGLNRIADASYKTLEDIPPAVETGVLRPSTVRQLDDMCRAVVEDPRGTGTGAADVPEARGKTGTTQGHKDVWFVGYTPQLVCVVWAGHPLHNKKTGAYSYGAEMEGGAWGATVCVPIWRNFMLQALPVYKNVLARRAAQGHPAMAAKPAVLPNPDPMDASNQDQTGDGYGDMGYSERRSRRRRRHRDDTTTYAANSGDTSPSVTDARDNPDGTRTATVDNDTGLLAPPGAPNTHSETFAPGAAPTVMSPQYDRSADGTESPSAPAFGDSSSSDQPRRSRRRSRRNNDTSGDTTGGGGDSSGGDSPRPRRRAETSRPQPDYVTVRVNPEDGKLATKWTPQYIERTYVKGQEPHSYSHMYQPPPGER